MLKPDGRRDRDISEGTKALPYNQECERIILGCILLGSEAAMPQCIAAELQGEDFSRRNGLIFEAMRKMFDARIDIDPITLQTHLGQSAQLEEIGGPAYISSLFDGIPRFSNIETYIKFVRAASLRRKVVKQTYALMTRAWDDDGEDVRADVERTIDALAAFATDDANPLVGYPEISRRLLDQIEERAANGNMLLGLPYGFSEIDYMTLGAQPGQLIIIAARPKQGKSALVSNISHNICHATGAHGLYFPLEMGTDEVAHRGIASTARVDFARYRMGQLRADEWKRVLAATERLESLNLKFAYTPNLSLGQLRAQVRLHRLITGRLDFIVIDYFQLMDAEERRGDTRASALSRISKGLKVLAMEEKVPIFLLSQLNREVEHRADPRPMLSDLRETGSLEQDADVIMFIYQRKDDSPVMRRIYIAAQRNGPTGEVDLLWTPHFMRFSDFVANDPEIEAA